MTDRLSTLMHDEAAALDVPPAPADRVIAAGRTIRRRRTTGTAAGVLAAVLAVVGLAVVNQHWSGDDAITPAEQKAYIERGAWAVGDELHIGNHVVDVPGLTSLRYTSLGVITVAMHRGQDSASTWSETILVRPNGRQETVDLPGRDRLAFWPPATDPATPYLAYLRKTTAPKRAQLVVVDLASGTAREVGDTIKSDDTDNPVSFVGDSVVVRERNGLSLIDRRTGSRADGDWMGLVTVNGYAASSYVTSDLDQRRWQVHRLDGAVLLTVQAPGHLDGENATLSPDGRYLAVPLGDSGVRVYTVRTGESVVLHGDRDVSDYGWTPDGHLVGKIYPQAESEVEICDPSTGTCAGTGIEVKDKLVLDRGADSIGMD